jgi:hypothetical protein
MYGEIPYEKVLSLALILCFVIFDRDMTKIILYLSFNHTKHCKLLVFNDKTVFIFCLLTRRPWGKKLI